MEKGPKALRPPSTRISPGGVLKAAGGADGALEVKGDPDNCR